MPLFVDVFHALYTFVHIFMEWYGRRRQQQCRWIVLHLFSIILEISFIRNICGVLFLHRIYTFFVAGIYEAVGVTTFPFLCFFFTFNIVTVFVYVFYYRRSFFLNIKCICVRIYNDEQFSNLLYILRVV